MKKYKIIYADPPWLIKTYSRPSDYNRIVQLMGDIPRIELFARQTTPGWDVWGNEVESSVAL